MNYVTIYNNLILYAKNRVNIELYETHHIIPKCMGGTDEDINLCKLTPREHYIAHAILCKIYNDNRSLAYAFHMMNVTSKNHSRYSSKLYEKMKYRLSQSMSIEHKNKISKSLKNKIKSEEHKQKISQSLTGKSLSDETKKKMSIAGSTRIRESSEYDSRRGRQMPESYKTHMKEKMKGKHKGKRKYNDGIKEYLCFPQDADTSWSLGRLKQ